jgi:prepilin-type N-terminal cleavage/methylation domain-containing protein/prepilin-type processing-associated H-X9-DG protein
MAFMKVRGFTLIELLVVIAVIAILIAVSMSAFRLAREKVNATVCKSNQRQLLVQFTAYEATHGVMPYGFDRMGFIQPPGGTAGGLVRDSPGWWWFNALGMETPHPLSNKPTILRCPSRRISDLALKYNCLYGNYGVNWAVCRGPSPVALIFREFKGTPLGTASLPKASQTLLIADSGYALISWYHAASEPPVPLSSKWGCETAYVPGLGTNHDRDLLPGQKDDALEGRHAKKTVNVGFADGHVGRLPAEALGVTKTEDSYTNVYPLWKPTRP